MSTKIIGSALLARLPERFQWSLHNLLAHPASEVAFQLGLEGLSNWMHDASIPRHVVGEGRG